MFQPEITAKIEEYLVVLETSEPVDRVSMVEGVAQNHGIMEYTGTTLPEVFKFILEEYTMFLQHNPELLVNPQFTINKLELFLAEETAKIDEANRLSELLMSYWFGVLDPRWHMTSKRLSEVVKSFRVVDDNYNSKIPAPNEI